MTFCRDCKWVVADKEFKQEEFQRCSHPKAMDDRMLATGQYNYTVIVRKFDCKGEWWEPKTGKTGLKVFRPEPKPIQYSLFDKFLMWLFGTKS